MLYLYIQFVGKVPSVHLQGLRSFIRPKESKSTCSRASFACTKRKLVAGFSFQHANSISFHSLGKSQGKRSEKNRSWPGALASCSQLSRLTLGVSRATGKEGKGEREPVTRKQNLFLPHYSSITQGTFCIRCSLGNSLSLSCWFTSLTARGLRGAQVTHEMWMFFCSERCYCQVGWAAQQAGRAWDCTVWKVLLWSSWGSVSEIQAFLWSALLQVLAEIGQNAWGSQDSLLHSMPLPRCVPTLNSRH